MSRFTVLLVLSAILCFYSVAAENTLFQEGLTKCNISEADKALLMRMQQPTVEAAVCFIKFANSKHQYLNSDGTYNIEKYSQKFIDNGFAVPADINTLANISIDTDPDQLVEKVFAFIKNNRSVV